MFFGGGFGGMDGMPGGGGFRRSYGPQRRAAPADDTSRSMFSLLQLLPIFFLIFVSFFNSSSEPAYSLAAEGAFRYELRTAALDVPFYVKSRTDFEQNYPPASASRHRVDRQIESEYYERVRAQCHQERMAKQRLSTWGRRRDAEGYATPWCDRMADIHDKLNIKAAAY